jgi:RNA polymerase sigma-70 factor (ECF subfamily)
MRETSIWLIEHFEAERPRLRALAYRMLGSLAEAEDAVQEAWLHLFRTDMSTVANLGGWLTTVVARICLNILHARKSRREESLDDSASAPIASHERVMNPEEEADLAEGVGLALLLVLDTLAPAERLAFVLHDLFSVPFDEIAPLVERTPAATRQLASRARRRVRGLTIEKDVDLAESRAVVDAFLAASREGSFDALLAVLDPDLVVRADHAAVARGMGREVRGVQALSGITRGARHLLGRIPLAQPLLVDGSVGIATAPRGWPLLLLRLTIRDDKIIAIDVVAAPAHIHQLSLAVLSSS